MRDGTPLESDKDLLAEWQEYFSSLLNNNDGQVPSDLPQPAAQDLSIHDHPPTLEETLEAIRQMKTNKAAGLDCAITAEALQDGGDAMADVIHCFCAEVYSNLTPPDQWITSVIVPVPKKGDLSLMARPWKKRDFTWQKPWGHFLKTVISRDFFPEHENLMKNGEILQNPWSKIKETSKRSAQWTRGGKKFNWKRRRN